MLEPLSEIIAIRVKDDHEEEITDLVATEIALTINVNGENLVSLLCSPLEPEAMALGFLISEGLLQERDDLRSLRFQEKSYTVYVELARLEDNWKTAFNTKTITSGCGHGVTFSDGRRLPDRKKLAQPFFLSSKKLRDLMAELARKSILFQKTGGVHSAGLATDTEIVLFAEDIGRHNAVDKLIGRAFLADIPVGDKILLVSGRISGEIMLKVVRSGIPVLISRTAPTCMALNYADDHGVTLIGFARGNRMNIYTHPLNIHLDAQNTTHPLESSDG